MGDMKLHPANKIVDSHRFSIHKIIFNTLCNKASFTAVVIIFVNSYHSVGDSNITTAEKGNVIANIHICWVNCSYKYKRATGYLTLHTGSKHICIRKPKDISRAATCAENENEHKQAHKKNIKQNV